MEILIRVTTWGKRKRKRKRNRKRKRKRKRWDEQNWKNDFLCFFFSLFIRPLSYPPNMGACWITQKWGFIIPLMASLIDIMFLNPLPFPTHKPANQASMKTHYWIEKNSNKILIIYYLSVLFILGICSFSRTLL